MPSIACSRRWASRNTPSHPELAPLGKLRNTFGAGDHSGNDRHGAGNVLFTFAAGQHSDHWLRFIARLEHNVQLARELTPLNQQEMLALNAKAQSASKQGLCSFVPTAEPKNRGGGKTCITA